MSPFVYSAVDTHSEYATLIAFPLQQLFREHTSMLRYSYIVCHVKGLCSVLFIGRACSTYGGAERCIQDLVETWWKETTWKTQA
jgi:hypothetical protein